MEYALAVSTTDLASGRRRVLLFVSLVSTTLNNPYLHNFSFFVQGEAGRVHGSSWIDERHSVVFGMQEAPSATRDVELLS